MEEGPPRNKRGRMDVVLNAGIVMSVNNQYKKEIWK
jgi:hypothetical protein